MTAAARQQPPPRRISDTKRRLQDQFLEQFRDTNTPCKHQPDMWMSPSLADRNRAKRLCADRCPLVQGCHAWATAAPAETYGVWGGQDHTPRDNKKGGTR